MIGKTKELSILDQHKLRCHMARLVAREKLMRHKTVAELVITGDWGWEIYSIDLMAEGSPYEPDDYIFHIGRRRPGGNIEDDNFRLLAREHLEAMPTGWFFDLQKGA